MWQWSLASERYRKHQPPASLDCMRTITSTENDAVDWLAVADELFPVDALQTAPPERTRLFAS